MQRIRRDAGGQKLLHERAELLQKIRPCHHGGIKFQLLAHLLRGEIERQNAPVLVQIFFAHAAADGKDPRCQPRKAQNLGIPADRIAAALAQRTLRFMRILLRNDQNLPGNAVRRVLTDPGQQLHGIRRPVRPVQKLQHMPASLSVFFSFYHAVRPKESRRHEKTAGTRPAVLEKLLISVPECRG